MALELLPALRPGTRHRQFGDSSTKEEFRKARRNGWRVAHHVRLDGHVDIDSIAISTAGLVVVETLWTPLDVHHRGGRARLAAATTKVAANAQQARKMVSGATGALPVWPVVVLWPAHTNIAPEDHDGVTVVQGSGLDTWLRSLPKAAITVDVVDRGWACLDEVVAWRDHHAARPIAPDLRAPTPGR